MVLKKLFHFIMAATLCLSVSCFSVSNINIKKQKEIIEIPVVLHIKYDDNTDLVPHFKKDLEKVNKHYFKKLGIKFVLQRIILNNDYPETIEKVSQTSEIIRKNGKKDSVAIFFVDDIFRKKEAKKVNIGYTLIDYVDNCKRAILLRRNYSETILAHEFGHILMLRHVLDYESIMFPMPKQGTEFFKEQEKTIINNALKYNKFCK